LNFSSSFLSSKLQHFFDCHFHREISSNLEEAVAASTHCDRFSSAGTTSCGAFATGLEQNHHPTSMYSSREYLIIPLSTTSVTGTNSTG
jgi:hypothetical protein